MNKEIKKALNRYKQLNRRFNQDAKQGREPRLNLVREWKKLHQLLSGVLTVAESGQSNV